MSALRESTAVKALINVDLGKLRENPSVPEQEWTSRPQFRS